LRIYALIQLVPLPGLPLEKLSKYFKRHIEEEYNHDTWVIEDLQSIGVSRKKVLSRKPSETVAEFVGTQYYWIYHWHPVCLPRYISFLEGNPPSKKIIDQIQKNTGYPDTAFRTITKHAHLDPAQGKATKSRQRG
jgi:hypothetical protein